MTILFLIIITVGNIMVIYYRLVNQNFLMIMGWLLDSLASPKTQVLANYSIAA